MWTMALAAAGGDPGYGGFVVIVLIIAAYFFPTIVAFSRGARNADSAFAVNFFLGWTIIGWVAALAMAGSGETRAEYQKKAQLEQSQADTQAETLAELKALRAQVQSQKPPQQTPPP